MNLWTARQQAEIDYKTAVRDYDAKPTQRNAACAAGLKSGYWKQGGMIKSIRQ